MGRWNGWALAAGSLAVCVTLLSGAVAVGMRFPSVTVLAPMPEARELAASAVPLGEVDALDPDFVSKALGDDLGRLLGPPGAGGSRQSPGRGRPPEPATPSPTPGIDRLNVETPAGGNDSFENPVVVQSVPFTGKTETGGTTKQSGEPVDCGTVAPTVNSTVWYRYKVPRDIGLSADTLGSSYNTVLTVYTGDRLDRLTKVDCNDNHGSGRQSRLLLTARAGQTLQFQVGGVLETGRLIFNLDGTALPATNDDFGRAVDVELSAAGFVHRVDTSGAGVETDEPRDCGGHGTVWYRFTPPAAMRVEADTFGSAFDTALAAYTGGQLAKLTRMDCNNNAGESRQSRLILPVEARKTYYFQAGGVFSQDRGQLTFRLRQIQPPAHDAFASASMAGSLPFADRADTTTASLEPGEPQPGRFCLFAMKATLWYRFKPAANMLIWADSFGSNFDTEIAVYRGDRITELTETACNDDAAGGPGGGTSRVEFPVIAGELYSIQAGGIGSRESGNLVFRMCSGQPCQ